MGKGGKAQRNKKVDLGFQSSSQWRGMTPGQVLSDGPLRVQGKRLEAEVWV